jgi:hypothetical protein
MFSIFWLLPHIVPAASGGWVGWGNGSNPWLAGAVMDIAGTATGAWAMARGPIVAASMLEIFKYKRDQKGEQRWFEG